MAQVSEITINSLPIGVRLDAEYYRPAFLINEEKLKKLGCWTLKEVTKELRSFGAYDLTNKFGYQNFGIPYVRCTDLKEGYVNFSNVYYIDEEANKLLWKSAISENTVLLAMSGSVGNSAVADEAWDYPVNSNQDVAKIVCNDLCNPYFLSAFLNSKHGRSQVLRLPVGSVQQHIFLWQIETILIPKFEKSEQEKVANTFIKALKQQKKSKSLYSQAEQVLLQELGLEDFTPEWVAGYETDFDNLLNVLRIDAEYFQPKYRIIEDKVKEYKNGWDYLPKLITVSKEKIQIEPEKEYQYVELADINASIGIVDSTSKIFGADLPSRAQMKLQKDDVVASSVEGSIDKVGLILSEDKNLVGSTGFHIFRSKAFTPEVNLILCKSPVLQYLFIREASGTILTAISSNSLKNIVVPKLDKAVQEKITKLVQESHKCVLESRQLLEQAKRDVEEMIESPR